MYCAIKFSLVNCKKIGLFCSAVDMYPTKFIGNNIFLIRIISNNGIALPVLMFF